MRLTPGRSAPARAIVAALTLTPILALLPAAVLDRGPGGSVRASFLYVALAVWDPFVWSCLWHSVTMAVIVSSGSWALGVALGRMIGRWRFWGRWPLTALALAPLAVPPLCSALGLRRWLGPSGPWPWPDFDGNGWLAWAWVELAAGVPLVALVTGAALRRVDPAWEDAARLAGATRRQVWSTVAWPIVRPEVARAVGVVFTLTMLEPAAPLVLGLRRTLAFQVVEAAIGGTETAPRAALLTLLTLAVAGLGQVLLRGRSHEPLSASPSPSSAHPRRASWPRALAMTALLTSWAILAWIPASGLLSLAVNAGSKQSPRNWPGTEMVRRLATDSVIHDRVLMSLGVGLATGAFGMILASCAAGEASRRAGRWAAAWRGFLRSAEAVPPLAVGVGAMLIPGLLWAAADGGLSGQAVIAGGLRRLADGLDPYRVPALLLVAALVTVHLPMMIRATDLGRRGCSPRLAETAQLLGASRRHLRRVAVGQWLGSSAGAAFVLTVALAATSLAPAMVLAPTAEGWPIGPAILIFADDPEGGLRRAADLTAVAIASNLLAFAFASRRRAGPLGEWFVGGR